MLNTEHTPKVSVIMPTYNRASFLKEALASVLNQSFQDFEIILVNNASTDNTEEVVKEFSNSRIRYYLNNKNIGAVKSHAKALRFCRGEYIYMFSDDDIMEIDNLKLKVAALDENPSVCLVHSACITINSLGTEEGEPYNKRHPQWRSAQSGSILNKSICHSLLMTYGFFLVFPTIMVRASVLEEHGIEFNNQLKYCIDWDLCLKLSLFGDFYYIEDKLIRYRQHASNEFKLLNRNTWFMELFIMKLSLYSQFNINSFETSHIVKIYKATLYQIAWTFNENLALRPYKDFLKEISTFSKLASLVGLGKKK